MTITEVHVTRYVHTTYPSGIPSRGLNADAYESEQVSCEGVGRCDQFLRLHAQEARAGCEQTHRFPALFEFRGVFIGNDSRFPTGTEIEANMATEKSHAIFTGI